MFVENVFWETELNQPPPAAKAAFLWHLIGTTDVGRCSAFISDRLNVPFHVIRRGQDPAVGWCRTPITTGVTDRFLALAWASASQSFETPVVVGIRGEIQPCRLGDYLQGNRGAAEKGGDRRVVEVLGLGGG